MTKIANIKNTIFSKDHVYIGRSSIYGNPFIIGKHGNRQEVIEKYKKLFIDRITNDPAYKRQVLSLKDKILVCHCKPLACHGDIIVEWLDK